MEHRDVSASAGSYAHGDVPSTRRLPPWLRQSVARPGAGRVSFLIEELDLHTVCQSAKCPNRGECFAENTATFMIMGDVCTRTCGFCAVDSGQPAPLDPDEPRRVTEAARHLGLRHVVITMVTRDDLPDGGAAHFAAVVHAVRQALPEATIEALTSDFAGDPGAVDTVVSARPDVFNHNVETVPRLYARVRPSADYGRSLSVLKRAGAVAPGMPTKSGLMLGLGESREEVSSVLSDLREHGVSMVTLGQYLRPGPRHLPVVEFVAPEVFAELAREARRLGFDAVASAPTVRSSYRAGRLADERADPGAKSNERRD